MDIRSMQLFIDLAEELHFGRAAARNHMSPSAATRVLQRLEAEVGGRLVERDNRRVQLTASGQVFLAYSRDALERWQGLLSGFSDRHTSPVGELRLYCSVTASYSILASFLPRIRMQYPGIEIHLNTGDQALAIPRIAEGQEDLAIAAHPGKLPDKLGFRLLARSPLVCVAPVIDCQLRGLLDTDEPLDWSAMPFIIAETGLARSRLEEWFRRREIDPVVYAYVSGHEAIVSLVALGFGIGVVPRLVLENSPLRDQIDILDAGPRLQPFDIGLVARKQRLLDPVVRVVWELAVMDDSTGVGPDGDLPSSTLSE